jgi:hypothetical protein
VRARKPTAERKGHEARDEREGIFWFVFAAIAGFVVITAGIVTRDARLDELQ